MKRHAEIAGAGFAGLTAACALAQRGWSVRVHERGQRLRTTGAGIYIYENGLRVLAAVGAFHRGRAMARQHVEECLVKMLDRRGLAAGRHFQHVVGHEVAAAMAVGEAAAGAVAVPGLGFQGEEVEAEVHMDRDILALLLRCEQRRFPCGNKHVDSETCQLASKHGKLLIVAVGKT